MSLVVVLNGALPADRLAALEADLPDVTFRHFPVDRDLEDVVADADVVAGVITPEAIRNAPNLKWVHSWGAGMDRVLCPELVDSPIILTGSKGNGAVPLAEHAVLMMLMLAGGAMLWVDAQRDHRWDPHRHRELQGLTCGIIGLGFSGADLARKLKAFDMTVLGIRRSSEPVPNVDELYTLDNIEEFLGRLDFLVITAPLTSETRGMLGEREFRAMKPTAFYICFSRGLIADDDVLLRALEEGWIAGAGLDAHGVEPLPPDSPFWTAPNTIITPHNGSSSPLSRVRAFDIFEKNLHRYLADEPLINLVDKVVGY